MACLDHECRECGEMWADNDYTSECPACGALNKTTFFDEDPEPHPEYLEEEPEEDDDDD